MVPKDKDNRIQKSGVIYQFKYPHSNCQEEYIGESRISFGEGLKECLRAPSPIHYHSHTKGYPINQEWFTIMHRESQGTIRTIKEVMHICVNDPSHNKNWRNTSCPIYGVRFFRTLHHYSSNNPTTSHTPNNRPPHNILCGGTQIGKYGPMWVAPLPPQLPTLP